MEWSAFSLLSPANAGIVDFSSFLLGTLLIILLPGPNSLYVLSISTQKGWRSGVWGALGIFFGDTVLMIAVALGAASLLASSPLLFQLIRIAGAIYLAWMGVGLLRSGLKRWSQVSSSFNESASDAPTRLMQLHPLVAALSLSLTNPKAIFFFIAFFAQFLHPDFPNPGITFIYLAVVLQMMSMAYLSTLILIGQSCSRYFANHPRLSGCFWMMTGLLFMGFALRLLMTQI